jgi:hypothetical protein
MDVAVNQSKLAMDKVTAELEQSIDKIASRERHINTQFDGTVRVVI